MRRSYFLLMVLVVYCCAGTQAQVNLVMNGSFEVIDTCPYTYGTIKAARYWNAIDTAFVSSTLPYTGNYNCTPTYANTCSLYPNAVVPGNSKFYQYPRNGNGLVNAWMYIGDYTLASTSSHHFREYTMGHLAHPLTGGQSYCVTFYVVMSNKAKYAIDHIGAYLDDGSIDTVTYCGDPHMYLTPQVQCH